MTDQVKSLSAESLDRYFESGVPSQYTVCSAPTVVVRIDPGAQRIELRARDDGTFPGLQGLRNVTYDLVDYEDGPWSVIGIDARDMRFEAYGLAVAIAEAMRGGSSFGSAVNAAMTNLRSLLAARARLSESQQLGLLGELLVLEALLEGASPKDVLEWWLGPGAEQHDLALPGVDVEIKTTLSERRQHRISGVDQLRPNPGRALWLVSVQLTRAGGADGPSLSSQVASLRDRLSGSDRFIEALVGLGWRDEDADLYGTRYLLRTTPRAYHVDADFPAITSDRLRAAVPHHDLLSEVGYRIDVTDRVHGMPDPLFHGFLSRKDHAS